MSKLSRRKKRQKKHQKKHQEQKISLEKKQTLLAGMLREKNGRRQRKTSQKNTRLKNNPTQTVITARQQKYNLTPEKAKTQKAGTTIGRMNLAGKITEKQFQAALYWIVLAENYKTACLAPKLKMTHAFMQKQNSNQQKTEQQQQKQHAYWKKQYQTACAIILKTHPLAPSILQKRIEEEIPPQQPGQIQILRKILETLYKQKNGAP